MKKTDLFVENLIVVCDLDQEGKGSVSRISLDNERDF